MKNIIDNASRRALAFNGDAASKQFYDYLRERQFKSTRCQKCGHVPFPPRMFCPACGSEAIEWFAMPTTGRLYAFSSQSRSLRFMAPDVLGLVEFADSGLVFGKIAAKLSDLSIGQVMTVGFFDIDAQLTVLEFRPQT